MASEVKEEKMGPQDSAQCGSGAPGAGLQNNDGAMAILPPVPSTSSMIATASNSRDSGGSSHTYSSALTDCWNGPSSSTSNVEPPETPTPQFRRRTNMKLVTCLFCKQLIFIGGNSVDKCLANRNKLIKTLCVQVPIHLAELPDQCIQEQFPFCNFCREDMEKIWTQVQTLRKSVEDFQKKVYDCDVMGVPQKNLHRLIPSLEAKKFHKLPQRLIQGKLFIHSLSLKTRKILASHKLK